MSVVIDSQPSGKYEPSTTEIEEYGKWLGMNLPEDNCFLWIAREGLKVPLPEHWKACKSEKGELYYFNFNTGESIWDHPMDEHYKKLFKSEKAHPSAQSVANGAKQTTPDPSMIVNKKGRKKMLPSVDVDGAKAPKLNSLMLNKVLPECLKVDIETGAGGGKQDRKGTLQPGNPESPQLESPKADVKVASILVSGKHSHDEVIASGVSGLKALSKLNSPNVTATPQPRHSGAEASNHNDAKERELATAKNNDDLGAFLKRLEVEKENSITQYRKEMDNSLIDERRKIDNEFTSTIEALRRDFQLRKENETKIMEKEYDRRLNEEKKEMGQKLEEEIRRIQEAASAQSSKAKENHLSMFLEGQKSVVDLKKFGATFLETYEQNYSNFSQSIFQSMRDMERREQEMIHERKEMDLELRKLKEDNRTLLLHEREKLLNEIEALKVEHIHKTSEIRARNEDNISQLKKDQVRELEQAQTEVKKLQTLCEAYKLEHDDLKSKFEVQAKAFENLSSIAVASSQEELNKLKREVIENTKAEMKAAVEEIQNETTSLFASHRNSMENLVSSQTSLCVTNSVSPTGDDLTEQVSPSSKSKRGFAPSLDNNLLRRNDDRSDACQPSTPPDKESIKNALTEILREIFVQSPFIIPSPSKASNKQQFDFVPSVMEAQNTDGQPRNDIIDSERRRLNQAEVHIEEQRQHLESCRRRLRAMRYEWKQQVIEAKSDGVRSNSQRGKELRQRGMSLERKSEVLERELTVLHKSELWLQKKKQRLSEYENLVDEHERRIANNPTDENAMNCSIDTGYLMTGFFNPDKGTSARPSSSTPAFSRPTSPMASALQRIESRLDAVSSMIDKNYKQKSRLSSPPLRMSPATPQSHGHGRPRQSWKHHVHYDASPADNHSATAIHVDGLYS